MKENEKQTVEITDEENEKSKKKIERQPWWPDWFTGRTINEPIFCREFLTKYRLAYTENSFFSVEGKVTDENALRAVIYKMVERFVVTGVMSPAAERRKYGSRTPAGKEGTILHRLKLH